MDVSTKDEQRIKNLQANQLLGDNKLVQLSEFTGSKDSDMEDMFESSFYLQLVNGAYEGRLSRKLMVKDLPAAGSRIVPKLEAIFKAESGADGKFDHYEPAGYLLDNQKELLPKLSPATLDRFRALFDRVNALLT